MPATLTLRDRLRTQLADLKMPGALEALDDILRQVDADQLAAGEAIHAVLQSKILLRNQRRLQTAMRGLVERADRQSLLRTKDQLDLRSRPTWGTPCESWTARAARCRDPQVCDAHRR